MRKDTPTESSPTPFIKRAVLSLVWAERAIFFAIGVLLFLGALALLKESATVLFKMYFGGGVPLSLGSQFLDVVLLVLMIVELAYTVILSLRGAVLQAEPFLIVGLIAVIRRMLVITVGEVGGHGESVRMNVSELGILTAIVIVFVGSIVMLRIKPAPEHPFREADPLAEIVADLP